MRRHLYAGLAVALGVAVALALGELVLRVTGVWIGRHSDTMFSIIEHDDVLGWKMPPNVSQRVDFVDVEGIVVRSNSDGFWDDEFEAEKRPGVCRVAFLGDSFTWGMGVEEGARFSDLVDSVDALNFGMPGFGTDQALLTWEHEARRFAPDVVLMTVYENDAFDNVHDVRYGRAKPYFEERERHSELALKNVPVSRATFWDHGVYNRIASPYTSLFEAPVQTRSRLLHWLVKHSDLVRLAYRTSQAGLVFSRLERQLGRGDDGRSTQPRRTDEGSSTQPGRPDDGRSTASQEAQEASTRAALRDRGQHELEMRLIVELRDRAAESGAPVIVAFAGKTHPGVLADMRVLRDAGMAVLDATTDAILPHLPPETPVYFPYNQHWTPAAHRVVGGLVTEAIQPYCGGTPPRRGEEPESDYGRAQEPGHDPIEPSDPPLSLEP